MKPSANAENPASKEEGDLPKIVTAQELFQGHREVVIEHGDVRYRLRITRRNKLILHK